MVVEGTVQPWARMEGHLGRDSKTCLCVQTLLSMKVCGSQPPRTPNALWGISAQIWGCVGLGTGPSASGTSLSLSECI